jgi:peroxiredoxin Q/BCP
MRGFQQRLGELQGLGARVAGVSADTWAANGGFAEAQGLEFPLLSDWPEGKTIAAFGVGREGSTTASRVTFVFDADGVVQAIIDDARDMEAHPVGALEAVRRLAGAPSSQAQAD